MNDREMLIIARFVLEKKSKVQRVWIRFWPLTNIIKTKCYVTVQLLCSVLYGWGLNPSPHVRIWTLRQKPIPIPFILFILWFLYLHLYMTLLFRYWQVIPNRFCHIFIPVVCIFYLFICTLYCTQKWIYIHIATRGSHIAEIAISFRQPFI